jgi:hypothetical protein
MNTLFMERFRDATPSPHAHEKMAGTSPAIDTSHIDTSY